MFRQVWTSMDKFGPILHIRQERFIASGMFLRFQTSLGNNRPIWTELVKLGPIWAWLDKFGLIIWKFSYHLFAMGRAQSFAQNPREDPCFFEEHFQTNLHRFGPIWTSLDKFRPIIKKKISLPSFCDGVCTGFCTILKRRSMVFGRTSLRFLQTECRTVWAAVIGLTKSSNISN